MQTYSILREFADSWMLLALTLVFLAVIAWAFRPGSRQVQAQAAGVIFKHDERPGTPKAASSAAEVEGGEVDQ